MKGQKHFRLGLLFTLLLKTIIFFVCTSHTYISSSEIHTFKARKQEILNHETIW